MSPPSVLLNNSTVSNLTNRSTVVVDFTTERIVAADSTVSGGNSRLYDVNDRQLP